MAQIDASLVKSLREQTGAGILDCKEALEATGGDVDQAMTYLRKEGMADAAKRQGRETAEGIVDAYIHMDGRIGVLLEVNCETDFVARTDEFKQLVHNLAIQVAAGDPEYVERDDVPQHVIEAERAVLQEQAENEGKPDHIVEQMVNGRLEKYFEQICLLEQPYVKDSDRTIGELIKENIAELGENIQVRRFARFEIDG